MKNRKMKDKALAVLSALLLVMTLSAFFPTVQAYADSGSVYTCVINRCYAHPVTGVIEDSGGDGSYATGQGMVEGCVYGNGILELTDSGAYYLTIRLSLMDYTSGHSFWVQNVGDSGWSEPSEIGITGNGTDGNGTTADVCIRVPSENCIVRGSMYVDSMGRDVIFYLYPSDYSEGNGTDMNATIVTESAGEAAANEAEQEQQNTYSNEGTGQISSGNLSTSESSGETETQADTSQTAAEGGTKIEPSGAAENTSEEAKAEDTSEQDTEKKLESTVKEAAEQNSETASAGTESSTLNSAEGLSLSTAKEVTGADVSETADSVSFGSRVFQIALAVVLSGLILIGVTAGIVYFFRRNWRRWGGAEDDDE